MKRPETLLSERRPTPRLRRGSLSHADALGVGLATIAPAYSLYMTLAFIAAGAGLGSPLVVLVAGIAMLFHVNSTAEFSRVMPSTGSYVAFLGRSFGQITGAATGVTLMLAYCGTMASILLVPGIWVSQSFAGLFGVNLAWWIPFLILDLTVGALIIIGVRVSTRLAIGLFIFEMVILLIAAVAILVENPGAITAAPFNPANITGGFKGFALAYPLAAYMFLGASNMAPLAEEMENPRRSVPRATFVTVYAGIVIYVIMTWVTMVGFHGNMAALAKAPIPLLDVGQKALGPASFVLYLGGFTSTMALAITAMNGMVRIGFNSAREGIFPHILTRVGKRHTPWAAVLAFMGLWFVIALVVGLAAGPMNAFNLLSSIGTIATLLVFVAVNVALPVLFLKEFRNQFSVVRHILWPVLGVAAYILPIAGFLAPGQPFPYNDFPELALVMVLAGIVYGFYRVKTHPHMHVGTIIADQELD